MLLKKERIGCIFNILGLYPMHHHYRHGHIQHWGDPCQPPKDEHRLRLHLCRHHSRWRNKKCWTFPRTSCHATSLRALTPPSVSGLPRYVSRRQRRWCSTIPTTTTTSFLPNVASPPVPISIAYSKRKKVAPQLSGEQKRHHKQPDKGHIIIWWCCDSTALTI